MNKIKKYYIAYKLDSVVIAYMLTLILTMDKKLKIENLSSMLDIFKTDTLISLVIFLASYVVFRNIRIKELNVRENIIISIFALIFSFIFIVGTDITYNNGLFRNRTNKYAIIMFLILIVISYIVFRHILRIFNDYFNNINLESTNSIDRRIETKKFLKIFIPIFLIRLVFFMIHFPGIFSWDSMYMIKEGVGIADISNSHPYLYVYILGLFARFGLKYLGGIGIGVGIFNFIVMLITAFTYAFVLYKVFSFNFNTSLKKAIYVYYLLNPSFILYSFTLYKDILLLDFLLFFVLLVIYITYEPKIFFERKRNLLYFIIVVFGVFMLHRKAVIYLVAGFIGLIFNKNYRLKTIKYIIISIIFCFLLNSACIFLLQPKDSKVPYDYLSTRFQQIASIYNFHKEDFNEEDLKIIEKCFGKENLKKYDIYESDPIKNYMDNKFFKEHKYDIFRIWLKGYINHPKTYIDALMNLSVSYWYPYNNPDRAYKGDYYEQMYSSKVNWLTEDENSSFDKGWKQNADVHKRTKFKNKIYALLLMKLVEYPILSIIHRPGIYTWIFIFLLMLSILRKNKKIIPLIFIVSSIILSCIYSPIVNYFRYSYVFVAIIPLIVAFVFIKEENKGNEKIPAEQ